MSLFSRLKLPLRKRRFVRSESCRRFSSRVAPAATLGRRVRSEPLPLILTSWRRPLFKRFSFNSAYGLVIGTLREKPSYEENNHLEIVALERPASRLSSSLTLSLSFSFQISAFARAPSFSPLFFTFCSSCSLPFASFFSTFRQLRRRRRRR